VAGLAEISDTCGRDLIDLDNKATIPKLLAALDLMRRMPPSRMEKSLEELIDLVPDLTDDLLNTVDQPLQLASDKKGNKYLLCDYNRDGDSYRSPWTNDYDPPLDDGVLPSAKLRGMESVANDVFDSYREMYYEGGVSSTYFWDLDDEAFAACVLFKKDATGLKKVNSGNWDAIHVIEVRPMGQQKFQYKLTSTMMVRIDTDHRVESNDGKLNLSGSLTRQQTTTLSCTDNVTGHVANMGRTIEDMENRMRDTLQTIYFGKTKSVVNGLYKTPGSVSQNQREALANALQNELAGTQARSGRAN